MNTCESNGRLSEVEKRLIRRASMVRKRAHAPYSGFKVGAALMCHGGRVFTGCNVENMSFGATVCAERNALAQAIACGKTDFRTLVVVTDAKPPASPCGICRQGLSEFCDDLRILLVNTSGDMVRTSLKKLFPQPFAKIKD